MIRSFSSSLTKGNPWAGSSKSSAQKFALTFIEGNHSNNRCVAAATRKFSSSAMAAASSSSSSSFSRRMIISSSHRLVVPLLRASTPKNSVIATTSKTTARGFSSGSGSGSNGASISSFLFYMGTFTAVGGIFYGLKLGMSSFGNDGADANDGGPVAPQAEITSKVFFDVSINNKPAGRVVIGMYGNVTPKTCDNFATLCKGTETLNNGSLLLTYKKSVFHRVIPGFMIQGGDFIMHNGYGGRSVFANEAKFEDENFVLKHTGPGIMSMANSGRHTNGSQFFITTAKTAHLNGKHVVFGVVVDGWDVVKEIESYGTRSGTPDATLVIDDCGILPAEETTTTTTATATATTTTTTP